MPEAKVEKISDGGFALLSKKEIELYNNLICPFCSTSISFGQNVVGKDVQCIKCKKTFSFEDGFIEKLAATPIDFLRIFPARLCVLQIGRVTIKIGVSCVVRFNNPFFKISGVYLTDSKGRIVSALETDQYVIMPVQFTCEGFRVVSSRKNTYDNEVTVEWLATGSKDERIPIWHIFLQNSLDLLNKAEYSAAIVIAMTTFDSYLDELLIDVLSKRCGLSEEFLARIILSPKFGRDELLSYWLKSLFGKSFTQQCPLNEKMKRFADMRRGLVHLTSERIDESKLTYEKAEECVDATIKSIKWINDLKLGKG